ncbi:MAG: type I 3-dehydroquinate dehydratase, partial [Thermoplasmata archaeon]|nr:type I 3-dehydroquinate dehydratase [Thermoplasmata archaeon]
MIGDRPLLVVSLPAQSVVDARREIEWARDGGADLAEVRFDRWTAEEQARVSGLFPSTLPLVATFRSRAEGGDAPDDPVARERVIGRLAQLPFAYLDLEWARDRRLESPTRSAGPRVIRSSHLGEGTPSDTIVQLLESGAPADGILKVVVVATVAEAIQHLLPLAERGTTPRAVLLTTGPSGPLFRAWARRLRLPWVYASLPEQPGRPYAPPVEPTQIPVDRLQPYLAVEDAPMFALLGHPVTHSRSPAIHHRWMARQGRVGLYTVLDVGSAEEFQLALQELPRRGVRGVNVTHPWKGLAFRC